MQVQYTLDTVITELSMDPAKRFIQVRLVLLPPQAPPWPGGDCLLLEVVEAAGGGHQAAGQGAGGAGDLVIQVEQVI